MPQIGWKGSNGAEVSFDEALYFAKEDGDWDGMPYEILKGIHGSVTKERPSTVSVTQLLGCARKVFLDSEVDYYLPSADNYAAFRGTVFHKVLEDAGDDSTVEERVERVHRGVTISGQPDSLRKIKHNGRDLLRDWKSVKSLPVFDNAYTHHQQQLNIYRWLLGLDRENTDLEIVYMDMTGVKVVPLKRGGVSPRSGRAIPNQVWYDHEVEAFLDQTLLILDLQKTHNTPMPYDKVPEEHLWQCENYCPVKSLCYSRAAQEARSAWAKGEDVARVVPRKRK